MFISYRRLGQLGRRFSTISEGKTVEVQNTVGSIGAEDHISRALCGPGDSEIPAAGLTSKMGQNVVHLIKAKIAQRGRDYHMNR